MHNTRIDSSALSHLPHCTCGWRGHITSDITTAIHQAANHERTPGHGRAMEMRARRNDATR